ncbi:XRE family transcriptional regulator [Staphylococcus capitis]|uniref:XRE family transcriptional regulator n=3 Tax=Staphylococcus capitis TaxID=29388 RepID=A0A7Z7YW13_STACP|nr:XRE family transcriptional regulator [Staphylococcus capitis]
MNYIIVIKLLSSLYYDFNSKQHINVLLFIWEVIDMIKFNLKKVMKQKNLNISQLNEMTGISRNSLSLLINGKSQGVQFETIEKITRALNIGIEELFEKSFNDIKIVFGNLYNITKNQMHTYQEGRVNAESKEFIPFGEEKKVESSYTFVGIGLEYIIDDTELEETIPFNFSLEFNTDNVLHLNILFENSNFKNDFIYLLDNVKNFENLVLTYITLKVLENLKQSVLKKIKNNFKIDNKKINVTYDLSENSILLPLNDALTVDYEVLTHEIKKTNDKSLYTVTYDNGIYFEYKSR